MKRLILALVLVGCAERAPVAGYPVSERELWTRSETIDAQAALAIAGLDRDHLRDDGSADWSTRLVRLEPHRTSDGTVYPFRLEITNESSAPVRVDAKLELREPDGALLRTRRLPPLLVAPWQKTDFIGIMRAPSSTARMVADVQRTDDGDDDA